MRHLEKMKHLRFSALAIALELSGLTAISLIVVPGSSLAQETSEAKEGLTKGIRSRQIRIFWRERGRRFTSGRSVILGSVQGQSRSRKMRQQVSYSPNGRTMVGEMIQHGIRGMVRSNPKPKSNFLEPTSPCIAS
jgi:hypothetical protein